MEDEMQREVENVYRTENERNHKKYNNMRMVFSKIRRVVERCEGGIHRGSISTQKEGNRKGRRGL